MRLPWLAAAALLCAAPALHAQQPSSAPAGWRVYRFGMEQDTVQFVEMAPGWHITTPAGHRTLAWDSTVTARGNYFLEAEIFLFPGSSDGAYGIFVGGRRLGVPVPGYLMLAVDRAGQVQANLVEGDKIVEYLPERRSDAVVARTGGAEPVKNVLRIELDAAVVRFLVNGQEVGSLPRSRFDAEDLQGTVGLWVGGGMSLHVSRLDLERHLAPQAPHAP